MVRRLLERLQETANQDYEAPEARARLHAEYACLQAHFELEQVAVGDKAKHRALYSLLGGSRAPALSRDELAELTSGICLIVWDWIVPRISQPMRRWEM